MVKKEIKGTLGQNDNPKNRGFSISTLIPSQHARSVVSLSARILICQKARLETS